METIKTCISCGMPMKTPSEFAGGGYGKKLLCLLCPSGWFYEIL